MYLDDNVNINTNTMNTMNKELVATKGYTTYNGSNGLDYILQLEKQGVMKRSGSRYFATKSKEVEAQIFNSTDYDFYCQYVEGETEKILQELNCVVSWNTGNTVYPMDDLAVGIASLHGQNVDIILRSDAALYTRVQENITPEFYIEYLWKRGPRKPAREDIRMVYNQLFRTAGLESARNPLF